MSSQNWYRGNTHTHTNVSDGNASPEYTAEWYHRHGYDWLVITDHNKFTPVEDIPYHPETPFLLIAGCEISMSAEGKPVHLCAVNPRENPNSVAMPTIIQTLQAGVDRTNTLGGIPIINHPNWCWAFTEYHMARVTDWALFEIFNPSTDCNNWGGGGELSMEERWDRMLSSGMRVFAVAADDSHTFVGEFYGHLSLPGLGWVTVRAAELTTEAICAALKTGDFYASTEIELEDYEVTPEWIRVRIKQFDGYKYTTKFIGMNGKVLEERFGTEAVYQRRGDEPYVRARIWSSNGGHAWCQPVFPDTV
ncbi:MAG TPA: CehA/McbA family metallohydrolase [Candidatus Latescibacteria bacterium]|nr:CehA/McbA family metallohydrolase [Candidatus Latescibacterota bacterium]